MKCFSKGCDAELVIKIIHNETSVYCGACQRTFCLGAALQEVERRDKRLKKLRAFARDVANNFDCDEDAHKYNTTCRACAAHNLLEETEL